MKKTLTKIMTLLIFNLTDCFSQYQFTSQYTEFGEKSGSKSYFDEKVTFKINQYSLEIGSTVVNLDFVRSVKKADGHSLLVYKTVSGALYSFYYYYEEITGITYENKTHLISYRKRIIRI